MSNSPNRAFGSSAKSKRKEVNLDLSTARQMLPLVRSIVRDIIEKDAELLKLHPEQDSLDRHRHDLVWAERDRRYRLHEEISATEKALKAAVNELSDLGINLVDRDHGRVAFPTRINGRPAQFSWQVGEENVIFWSYEEEEIRRPIPSDWVPGTPLRLKGKIGS
jgi:hypothetical protein